MQRITEVLTPAATYNLTTVETAREELGLTDISDPTVLRWIASASDRISRYCNRVLALESVRETFLFRPGESARALRLSRFPVTAITSVVIDGSATSDYAVDEKSGVLSRTASGVVGTWCGREIVITYSGGYELLGTLPRTIEDACLALLRHRAASRTRDPMLRQLEIPGVSVETYWVPGAGQDSGLPPEVEDLLADVCAIAV